MPKKIYKLKRPEITRNKSVWMGIDAHKESLHITVVDSENVLDKGSYEATRPHLEGLVKRLPGCQIRAVYEAGPTGYQLLRWLRELGCDAFMTPPSLVPVRKGERVKTDRRDSLKLAELLRAKMLTPVHDLSDETYEHRELVRTREQIVRGRTRIRNQIKSKLLFHGVSIPAEVKDNWSKGHLAWLKSGPSGRPKIDASVFGLLAIHESLTEQLVELTRQIEGLSETEMYSERANLLMTLRGVGTLTAMIILVELMDFDRFGSAEELASFLGLIPSEHSTGERVRKGHLTRTGNRRVRTALVEASWVMIRNDPELKRYYQRIRDTNKRGSKRAIVAVARKLSGRIRAMLRDSEPYHYPVEVEEKCEKDMES